MPGGGRGPFGPWRGKALPRVASGLVAGRASPVSVAGPRPHRRAAARCAAAVPVAAHRLAQSRCVPLRRGLRPQKVFRQGRPRDPDRGRPGQPHLPRPVVPFGHNRPREMGLAGSPSIWVTRPSLTKILGRSRPRRRDRPSRRPVGLDGARLEVRLRADMAAAPRPSGLAASWRTRGQPMKGFSPMGANLPIRPPAASASKGDSTAAGGP